MKIQYARVCLWKKSDDSSKSNFLWDICHFSIAIFNNVCYIYCSWTSNVGNEIEPRIKKKRKVYCHLSGLGVSSDNVNRLLNTYRRQKMWCVKSQANRIQVCSQPAELISTVLLKSSYIVTRQIIRLKQVLERSKK